jgi:hexosaminidase
LQASLPPTQGMHSLCMLTTTSPRDPYYGVGHLQLRTAGDAPAKESP